MTQAYIAVDFGAGSGRVIAGLPGGDGSINIIEIHRFENRRVRLGQHVYWDFPALWAEMIAGLRKAVDAGYHIESIGVDTWGVDFGLLDARGNLLGNPVCYRDPSIAGAAERFLHGRDTDSHYSQAGIQIMDINSLYRLADMAKTSPEIIAAADRLLFMPDLFCYYLTGVACNEYTISTTSGLIDARSRMWNRELIAEAGLPERLFGNIVMPGDIIGYLTDDVLESTGINYKVPVVAVASHDTASAVAEVKAYGYGGSNAFISSGTWSLLGVVTDSPILTPEAREAGFSNEGAAYGKICLLQNITGLWIMQRMMEQWGCNDYDEITARAEESEFESVIDVDDDAFVNPTDMCTAIDRYCESHDMKVPTSRGDYARCALQSLAMRYKRGIDDLNRLLPHPVTSLTIVGGGSRNRLLNELTHLTTGLPVVCGAAEATAMGNIAVLHRAAQS